MLREKCQVIKANFNNKMKQFFAYILFTSIATLSTSADEKIVGGNCKEVESECALKDPITLTCDSITCKSFLCFVSLTICHSEEAYNNDDFSDVKNIIHKYIDLLKTDLKDDKKDYPAIAVVLVEYAEEVLKKI